jgi:plasmid stabilization system protein ParE
MVASGVRQVVLRPEAEAELADAVDWYESRGKGLGADLLRSVDAVIAAIQRSPEMYPNVFATVRRAMLRRFPYSLIYVVSDDRIVILACMHGRRDPHRWRERV